VGAICKASLYDQGTNPVPASGIPLTCSSDNAIPMSAVVTADVNGTGECVANDSGYVNGIVSGNPDLAAAIPCGTTLPLCNHGDASAVGTIQVGFWPADTGGVYTSNPDPNWQVGVCSVSIDVASGHCVDIDLTDTASVTCVGIDPLADLGTDFAVLVNADAALGEFSGLDNWTLYRPGKTCSNVCHPSGCGSGGASAAVYAERYQAVCPVATAAQWSMLWWDASTPGASEITFEWRAADTEAALDAMDGTPNDGYVDVGVHADATRPVCDPFNQLAGPTDDPLCPVVLSATMDAGQLRAPWIDMRITVEPEYALDPAGAAVMLNEWQLYFDCLESE
jgi:hypothetical protein